MFGFQRIGDLIFGGRRPAFARLSDRRDGGQNDTRWQRVAASGRHESCDGTTIPNCRAYDPAFAYEVSAIVDEGMQKMMTRQNDVFYYMTVTNENYARPSAPGGSLNDATREGILRCIYRIDDEATASDTQV